MKNKELYEKAIAKFGKESQLIVACEELGELIQAISKYQRGKGREDTRKSLIGEIADVLVMIKQLMLIADISDTELYHMLEIKAEHLKKLVSEEG